MRSAKEDEPCKTKPTIDLVSAVEELHKLSSRDLSKLISEADDGIIQHTKDDGSLLEINMESLITNLALHLISKLLSSKRDEQHLRYLLSGIRLLHGLSNISSRHPKLEKFLFNDMILFDRILDLVFFITIFLSNSKQKLSPPILPPSLLASSLYLLKIYISQEWHELATIILVHPKGDVFITAVCPAVRVVIGFLQVKLSDTHIISNVDEVNRVCLDCEASLQFLGSLCNILKFRESLVNNKELFADGGVLLLVRDIMKLPQCEDSNLMDAVSRLKLKVLSIMLHLCEMESISFLDLAASTTQGLDFAKSALSEVLKMLKIMFSGNVNGFKPRGIMHHVAMTLTEIFSDETNFRSYIVSNFTEVLTREFLLPHGKFLSTWCSSNSELVEKDVILNYDSFSASGLALDVMSASRGSKSSFTTPPPSYTPFAYQKTSLLVKIIANLTCFVPDVCKEERGAFVNKFFKCLQKELSNSQDGVEHAARNLRSLLGHAGSLTPGFLHEDDVTFLRLFVRQLEKLITPKENNIIQVKEVDNRGKSSSPEGSGERGGDESEGDDNNNIETIGSYLSNMQLKSSDQINKNNDDEVPEEETHQLVRKRKRNLMNDVQMGIIQNALQDDPHMQRRPATIQLWADKLSRHGSEITSSQLKNWLNNRKAKIAREAAKHAVVASSGESDALTLTLTLTDKQDDHVSDSNSPSPAADDSSRKDDVCEETKTQSVTVTGTGTEVETVSVPRGTSDFKRQAGQYVVLVDEKGDEIGKGRIHLAKGTWFDTNLQECGLCVVDVNDLKVDDTTLLPHPCDVTGTTFRTAQQILNRKRVLWESNKLLLIQQLPN